MRHQYQSELEDLATDTNGIKYLINNNYLITMQQIITKATAELADYMDQDLKSEKSSVNIKQVHGRGNDSRERCSIHRGLNQRSNRESPQGSDRGAKRRSDRGRGFN